MLACNMEDRGVKVEVFAGIGEYSEHKVLPVGTYLLRENDQVNVGGAANFGHVPFRIKVVKVRPFELDQPSIRNHTKSLEVVKVEAADTTFLLTS